MIDFNNLREAIRSGLQEYLRETYEGFLVVEMRPGRKRPELPFMTMDFITPFTPEGGSPSEKRENIPSSDSDFEHDVEVTRFTHDTATCSFSIYAEDEDEAVNIALAAHGYFREHGRDKLKEDNIVPANVMVIQNRDVFLVDAWERRVGFDVEFRFVSSEKRVEPSIETVELNFKESEN